MKLGTLASQIQALDATLAKQAASAVNISLTARNWLIGAYLVEFEQKGEDRAKYGEKLIPELASRLKEAGVKGLATPNLQRCRQFYTTYPQIYATLSHEFPNLLSPKDLKKHATLSHLSRATGRPPNLLQPTRTRLINPHTHMT